MTAHGAFVSFRGHEHHHTLGRRFECMGGCSIDLSYLASNPYIVELEVIRDGTYRRWEISRELLVEGMTEPAGLGMVHVCPTGGMPGRVSVIKRVALATHVELILPRRRLQELLDRSHDIVPAGAESDHYGWDAVFAALGGGC
ncbi:SsgA family sporulation/cell division regulator [Amycolatopsis carbonis]|uniref:SsgA family sporulation/cell division regulator n=1 Tax=Amycolatopsis carbonis TaxID=715471 RepID=A0A9Y2MSK4_9PSEU|nr:SsgA family sporulation/cell division regulator [Amycolatopsis sp. 2-15]WIX75983.1 SsgA family sporulation/cell division regulator [Amycolatopsis sp. 2-15]